METFNFETIDWESNETHISSDFTKLVLALKRKPGAKVEMKTWTQTVKISEGSFGIVYLFTNKEDGTEVAVKIPFDFTKGREVQTVNKINQIKGRCSINNKTQSVIQSRIVYCQELTDPKEYVFVMEAADGALNKHVLNQIGNNTATVAMLLKNQLAILWCLYKADIYYTDSKMANILYSIHTPENKIRIQLADLDESYVFTYPPNHRRESMKSDSTYQIEFRNYKETKGAWVRNKSELSSYDIVYGVLVLWLQVYFDETVTHGFLWDGRYTLSSVNHFIMDLLKKDEFEVWHPFLSFFLDSANEFYKTGKFSHKGDETFQRLDKILNVCIVRLTVRLTPTLQREDVERNLYGEYRLPRSVKNILLKFVNSSGQDREELVKKHSQTLAQYGFPVIKVSDGWDFAPVSTRSLALMALGLRPDYRPGT